MAIIAIGGHSRNIGKTSVVAGLIAGLAEMRWTAVKITQIGHGICSESGEECGCALVDSEHSWALDQQFDRSGANDTSRFLLAGAVRSFWLRAQQGKLAAAMPALRKEIAAAENVIIESTSVLEYLQPDLFLIVLDYAISDFKDSMRRFLDRSDAIILNRSSKAGPPEWEHVAKQSLAGKPVFLIEPPPYVTPEIVNFVRELLQTHAAVAASPRPGA